MTVVIGDVHGKTSDLCWMLEHNPKLSGHLCFQLGDMGLGFRGVILPEQPRDRFLFTRGNHDSPEVCRAHPNYAGDYGYLADHEMFFLGGAWSIDQAWRVEGVSWWRDEELSATDLNKALQLYGESKPRYVVTHEAPSSAAISILSTLSIHKDPAICANTRTSQVLQQMLELHAPEEWIFGHYHVNYQFIFGKTRFRCLNELYYCKLGER